MQQDGESAEDFVTALHTLSKDCEFGALREEFMGDRLVVGVKGKHLSARLQLDAKLTLQKALDAVRQIESVRQQQAELHQCHLCAKLSDLHSGARKASHPKATIADISKAVADKVNPKEELPAVFQGLSKVLKEHRIQLQLGVHSFALSSPRRIRISLYEKTKPELQSMQNLGVISPVDEPTEWCAPMVVVPKPSGDVRICVDFTELNRHVPRERHPLPSV
ncbi:hypothetical protein MTO96_035868 [Rhipicephalus appendiculatus]